MKSKQPNIILIMSDNHPADMLGCHGNEEVYTPNLDQLAQEGMQFNQAFCVNAMCSPCRASVLTGLMPSQHGIHTWIDDRRMERWPDAWNALEGIDTLPEILGRNGYDTALIGKYHLGNPFAPQNGFEEWVTFPHGHTRDFWGNTIIDNGQQYTHEGHIIDFFTDKAVDYVGRRAGEENPFFMFLSYNAPYGHWPAIQGEARNRFAARYAESPMHSVPREGLAREVFERVLLTMHDSGQGLDYSATMRIPNDLPSLRNYYSQMSMVDDGVGRVLAALDEAALAEDTLIIYTCDHGFSLGHNGFWGHGQATWPANAHRPAYHIPLLMRWVGGIPAGRQSNNLVSQIDLFPTVLDYAGVEASIPQATHSLVDTLNGVETDNSRASIFIEQEETRAIRTPEWLYVQRFNNGKTEQLPDALFHLPSDPEERHNVLDEPENEAMIRSLRSQLEAFFDANRDPQFDLWQGGTTKSNTSRPWFWPQAWGEQWQPVY